MSVSRRERERKGERGRERSFEKDSSFLFSYWTNPANGCVWWLFLPRATETITFMSPFDKYLELLFQNFFTDLLESSLSFSWCLSIHIISGCIWTFLLYCLVLPNQHSWRVSYYKQIFQITLLTPHVWDFPPDTNQFFYSPDTSSCPTFQSSSNTDCWELQTPQVKGSVP